MLFWRMRGKIVGTVLCCIVYHNCSQSYDTHISKQFLQVRMRMQMFNLQSNTDRKSVWSAAQTKLKG